MCVDVFTCACLCGGQRSASGICLFCPQYLPLLLPISFFSAEGSLREPGLTTLATLAGQQAAKDLLYSASQHMCYRSTTIPISYLGAEDPNSGSQACTAK